MYERVYAVELHSAPVIVTTKEGCGKAGWSEFWDARMRHLFEGKVVERVSLDDLAYGVLDGKGLVPIGSRWVGKQLVVECVLKVGQNDDSTTVPVLC